LAVDLVAVALASPVLDGVVPRVKELVDLVAGEPLDLETRTKGTTEGRRRLQPASSRAFAY
jgi:hypothetical protein